ncbi:MAG: hypothetical protein ACRC7O_13010, partial [Fimbriiglobus sp.]
AELWQTAYRLGYTAEQFSDAIRELIRWNFVSPPPAGASPSGWSLGLTPSGVATATSLGFSAPGGNL